MPSPQAHDFSLHRDMSPHHRYLNPPGFDVRCLPRMNPPKADGVTAPALALCSFHHRNRSLNPKGFRALKGHYEYRINPLFVSDAARRNQAVLHI